MKTLSFTTLLLATFWLGANRSVFSENAPWPKKDTNTAIEMIRNSFEEFYRSQKFFSLDEAEKRYGKEKFDSSRFQSGNWKVRSKMAVNMIESKVLIGKTDAEVRAMLGPPDGFFWVENIPGYIIEDGRETKKVHAQIVIFSSGEHGKKRADRVVINWETFGK